jgi:large subunit ribosomal protein L24
MEVSFVMNKVHVKTGDTVVLLTGSEAGKNGKVLEVSPKEGKVIVEGVNIITKHVKPTRVGQQGGIVQAEAPLYASKVQLVCPKCGKATRVGHTFEADGEKVNKLRVCKKCGKSFK